MFEELADLMEVKKAEILAEVMHHQNKMTSKKLSEYGKT